MAFEPNMQRRKDLVSLREFVAKQANGARVSWVEVEQQTGVKMGGQQARNLFRSACHREKRPYLPLPGGGVEFSSAANAIECVDRFNVRVSGAIRSAAEKGGQVVERHVAEMPSDQAKALLRAVSITATLSMISRSKDSTPPALPEAKP